MFYRAIVTENQDPQKLGRVKVRYLHYPSGENTPSEWASLCQPYASRQSGSWCIPEIGDEVLAVFEGGDLEHPTILGSIYTDENPPPQAGSTENNDLKFIKTRSGHTLSFNDKSGSQKLLVQDSNGNSISMENSQIEIKNKSGAKITLNENSIQIEAEKVSIQKATNIELGSGASEAVIKGKTFMQLFNSHMHTCSGPGGSSSPPMSPMTPDNLSEKVKVS